MFIKLLLIIILIPLQACSNTLIGEKLENSFDIGGNQSSSLNSVKSPKKSNGSKEIEPSQAINKQNFQQEEKTTIKESKLNKAKISQKSNKSIKKVIFKPQPYRIILKLNGANPSSPAEALTKALRAAGIKFEVERIERLDNESYLKKNSLNR